MHRIEVITDIHAPPQHCFDLARDMAVHMQTSAATGERIIAGKTAGLLELGDEVTFEARHLGIRQRLSARITAFDPPRMFRDEMIRGAFTSLTHEHRFEPIAGCTRMTDIVTFTVPLGPIGWPVGEWMVRPHLRKFLIARGAALREIAQAGAPIDRK